MEPVALSGIDANALDAKEMRQSSCFEKPGQSEPKSFNLNCSKNEDLRCKIVASSNIPRCKEPE